MLDTRSWAWRELRPADAAAPWPSARSALSMTWHVDRLLVFGGKSTSDKATFLADLWALDVDSVSWCAPRLDLAVKRAEP